MSTTKDVLNDVIKNVLANKAQVMGQKAQIPAQTISPEAQEAMDFLEKSFGNIQNAINAFGQQAQLKQISKAEAEMDTLIAGVQVLLTHEHLLNEVVQHKSANLIRALAEGTKEAAANQ